VSQITAQAHDVDAVKADKGSVQKTPQKPANAPRQNRGSKPAGAGQSSKPFFTVSNEGVFIMPSMKAKPYPPLKSVRPCM
jgi:hypothetical protein